MIRFLGGAMMASMIMTTMSIAKTTAVTGVAFSEVAGCNAAAADLGGVCPALTSYSGKSLTIEYIGGICISNIQGFALPANLPAFYFLLSSPDGTNRSFSIPNGAPPATHDVSQFGANVTVYISPDESLNLVVEYPGISTECKVTISGHVSE